MIAFVALGEEQTEKRFALITLIVRRVVYMYTTLLQSGY